MFGKSTPSPSIEGLALYRCPMGIRRALLPAIEPSVQRLPLTWRYAPSCCRLSPAWTVRTLLSQAHRGWSWPLEWLWDLAAVAAGAGGWGYCPADFEAHLRWRVGGALKDICPLVLTS